jgi:hypothetical protein
MRSVGPLQAASSELSLFNPRQRNAAMIVVWQGAGGLVLLAPIIMLVFMNVVTDATLGNNYGQAHTWPKFVAMALAGLLCWFVGRYLHTRPAKVYVDKQTGQEIRVRPRHTRFFIPLEYWEVAMPIVGLVYVLATYR